ncbi:MFS transporter [Veronia pacifica]|nr:MFS transporter [Veronia pacifica]
MLINLVAVSLLSLTLQVVSQQSEISSIWLGIWFSSFAAGTGLTTLGYTFFGQRLSHLRMLQITPIGQAVGLILFAIAIFLGPQWFNNHIWPAIAALSLFVYGLNLGVGSVIDNTLLQQWVPENVRGTVFSLFSSLRFTAVPLGLLIAGYCLDAEMTTWLFFFFIITLLIATSLWLRASNYESVSVAGEN